MLVLQRKPGEDLVIDGDIVVTVLSVCGDRVRLGVSAPPAVSVDRREVHLRRIGEGFGVNHLSPLAESEPT